jgi:uncharacterized protein YceK
MRRIGILMVVLLVVGCSSPVVDTSDTECIQYYTSRLGLKYAKEVCN